MTDEHGKRAIPAEIMEKYVDKKIFIKGYIWSDSQLANGGPMPAFIFLKDNGECCFGGDPAAYDNMSVRMQDGTRIAYREGLVSIAGTLRADPTVAEGEIVYRLEATQCGTAKSAF